MLDVTHAPPASWNVKRRREYLDLAEAVVGNCPMVNAALEQHFAHVLLEGRRKLSPGIIHLAQGMPRRILISTADFQKRYDFPFICSVMAKNFLQTRRDTVRRITISLV